MDIYKGDSTLAKSKDTKKAEKEEEPDDFDDDSDDPDDDDKTMEGGLIQGLINLQL